MMTMIIIARGGPLRSFLASSVSVATQPNPTNENTASDTALSIEGMVNFDGSKKASSVKPDVSG